MTSPTHAQVHADHRQRGDDVRHWRDDVATWNAEQKTVFAALQAAVAAQTAALEAHAGVLGEHEGTLLEHEHYIVECEKLGRPEVAGSVERAWADSHDQEAVRHAGLREAHERIRRHHYTVMARLRLAAKALAESM
jgi:hypothetical protein